MGLRSSMILVRRRRALELRARAAHLDDRQPLPRHRGLPGHRADRADDRRRRSSAATCASSASAPSPPPASSASSSRCGSSPARSRSRSRAFRRGEAAAALERTDRDISIVWILLGVVVARRRGRRLLRQPDGLAPASSSSASLLTLLFSFFFTSVAANAIATIARNPVSGMTMLTIIISSVVLLRFGLSGQTGMFFVMAIAGMVCTALSVSGADDHRLKTGYWLGSTPSAQERVKFLGVLALGAHGRASPSSCWRRRSSSARRPPATRGRCSPRRRRRS